MTGRHERTRRAAIQIVLAALGCVVLAHALPVPASLGALEGAQAVVFDLAGSSAGLMLVAVAVARLRDLVWTIPGALYLALRVPRWRAPRSRTDS